MGQEWEGKATNEWRMSTSYHYGKLKLNPAGGIVGVCVKWTQRMGKGADIGT